MVVDYRELNRVTIRKFFLIPNSDYIKSTVAGNVFISVGDLKEGFNQVDNEEETEKDGSALGWRMLAAEGPDLRPYEWT